MGNYAGNFDIEDIDWLAGFIDSDGSINLCKHKSKKTICLQPKVCMYNSNDDIITNVDIVLNKFGINHHIYTSDRTHIKGGTRNFRKLSTQISIRRLGKIVGLSDIILNNLVGRRNQLIGLSEFCRYRLAKLLNEGKKCKYDAYSLKFTNIVNDFNVQCNLIDYGFRNNSLYWLAGLGDGDGCFTIKRIRHKNGRISYRPYISFTATNQCILNNVIEILEMYGIKYNIRKRSDGKKYGRNRRFICNEIEITTLETCHKLVELLKNRVRGKVFECELLYSFCETRIDKNTRPYSRESIKLYELMKKEKVKYNVKDSSTTI
jgi:hypothetical protein